MARKQTTASQRQLLSTWLKVIRYFCSSFVASIKLYLLYIGTHNTEKLSLRYLERTLSTLATWIQDLAPQARMEITLEQYEDEDAHIYVHPPQAMTANDVERLELAVGERCNEILLDTGLFIVSAVCA